MQCNFLVKKARKVEGIDRGGEAGAVFNKVVFGYPQCGSTDLHVGKVLGKFWIYLYVGRGSPTFVYFCRSHKCMIPQTLFFRNKRTIYIQKSLFTHKML